MTSQRALRGLLLASVVAAGPYAARACAQLAETTEAASRDERRVVLVLASRLRVDRAKSREDIVHDLLQLPIEHAGGVVRTIDARVAQPPVVDWSHVRAVVTAFRNGDRASTWVWPWLAEVRRQRDVRFVHFGEWGPLAEDVAMLERWLGSFGLEGDGSRDGDPRRVDVLVEPGRNCAYEGAPRRRWMQVGPRSTAASNRVWLRTRDRKTKRERTPIVTGSWGGIAFEPFAVTVGGADQDRRWHIDPFAFFTEALGLEGVPCADPNVVFGHRAFFFHVDGDGFESPSTVERDAIAGEVFFRRIVRRYELPMSLSVIVASLTADMEPEAPTRAMQVAREMFAAPHVEIASHGVLHPLDWRKKWTRATPRRVVNWYGSIANYRHDMIAEVRESIRFIDEHLAPEGKRCRLMFWSGQANPTAAALRAARLAGCLNLNGGVARWDALTNSVGYVQPRGLRVEDLHGAEFQIYCGAPNENVFDGFFSTMPTAFRHVSTTLENCGRERILKPVDLYAHFYSAERPARLRTLRRLIERWGIDADTAPIFASDYAAAVVDARRARVLRRDAGWSLRSFERCRTVRLESEDRDIDWSASDGVLGERRIGRARYVHLSKPNAELVFTEVAATRAPHLVSADHIVRDAVRSPTSVRLRSHAWSRRRIVFGGFARGAFAELVLDGRVRRVSTDEEGRVIVELPAGGAHLVEVRQS